ncbi:MAG: DUF2065 domain-containing protein [Gammaproteobacteria bacterium RIFOXYA12_FULL_61_12]|nr:MAG: DUF2065 domain-containing protein [Gammaproteobacteria bacterium RIFOXYD12_FULL_61_37]OGT94140.1 MAG: DUF2065 domain-containing protein [Gammaproteobacteria bacterium RIFOXYA12_FULL_61_12]
MWQDLLVAFSLMFVMEGLMPFLNPRRLREALLTIAGMDDRSLRIVGLISMASGVAMLYLVR